MQEGRRMQKAGIQSYEWVHEWVPIKSSVGGTAAPPVAASSSLPEEPRWNIDMKRWVTFDEMKAFLQRSQGLSRDYQVLLEYWDTLPKKYERRWEIDMNNWVTFDQMKAFMQPNQELTDYQVLQYWNTLPKQSDYSDQAFATSSLPDERRWYPGVNKLVTFEQMKAWIPPTWHFTDDDVWQYWYTLPKQSDLCDFKKEPASSGLN